MITKLSIAHKNKKEFTSEQVSEFLNSIKSFMLDGKKLNDLPMLSETDEHKKLSILLKINFVDECWGYSYSLLIKDSEIQFEHLYVYSILIFRRKDDELITPRLESEVKIDKQKSGLNLKEISGEEHVRNFLDYLQKTELKASKEVIRQYLVNDEFFED